MILEIFGILAIECFAADSKSLTKTPSEIIEIMDKSKTKYSMLRDTTAKFSFSVFTNENAVADPDWVVTNLNGKYTLEKFTPNKCSEKLARPAINALNQKEYDLSIQKYQESFACDSVNTKYLTYIGNVYFYKGRFDSAKKYLRASISLNPDDYQAHFFLSDVFSHLNQPDSAKAELIYALMLNRSSSILKKYAENLLSRSGQVLFENPFELGFNVQTTQDEVQVIYGNPNHIAAAICFAAWQYDEKFSQARKDDDPFHRSMLKNIFINQYLFGKMKLDKKEKIDKESQKLMNILDDHMLQTMILWEQASRISPAVIYTLPIEEKDRIRQYIGKYLIGSK